MVGREIYIMYTKETTCWAVAIDGYWVLLPSVDTDERSFPFDSLRNVLDMKKLAHVFPSRFTALGFPQSTKCQWNSSRTPCSADWAKSVRSVGIRA